MKKVLLITPGILPVPASMGGAVEYLTELYLTENDKKQQVEFDVTTITYQKKVKNPYQNTNLIWIKGYPLKFQISRAVRYLFNKIFPFYIDNAYIHEVLKVLKKRKEKYDLIFIENNPLFVKSIRKIDKNTKIILHLHNDYLNDSSKHHQYLLDQCERIYTVSDYIGKRVQTIAPTDKVVTLYNGIEIEKFNKKASKKEILEFRKSYGISEDDFVILFAGRLIKEKGILELLMVFKKLLQKNKNMKLLIVGSKAFKGSRKDGFIRKLNQLAKDCKDHIIFTGFLDYDKMPLIYQASNVSVVPSNWGEPLATTVIEGIESGIFQIVTNDGGIPEMVAGTSAKVIDKNHLEEELFHSLEEVIKNKENIKRVTYDKELLNRFHKDRYVKELLDNIK